MIEKENRIKVANDIREISFKENGIACINIAGRDICLIKTSGGLKACSSKCPHAGGDLSEAFLDKKENIICPVHGYRFSMQTGRDTNGEGYFLKLFLVEETDDGIFINLK